MRAGSSTHQGELERLPGPAPRARSRGPARAWRGLVYRLSKSPLGRWLAALAPARWAWRHLAQAGELEFHRTNRWRATDDFVRNTEALFAWMGLAPDAFAGRTVVDLGAGSRLRTRYFVGAEIVALEPLADRFRAEVPWCDLDAAAEVHATAAEQLVPSLERRADAVLSINVLDHCYAFAEALANVHRYLKPGGRAILSFDGHAAADAMHPLALGEADCRRQMEAAGFTVERVARGLGPLGATYGHGEAMTFWLTRT